MNRADRRREAKEQARVEAFEDMRNMNPDKYFALKCKAMENLQRNGITAEDLKKNWDLGYEEGVRVAAEPMRQLCYAAVCLALNDLYGFGSKRCCDVLNAMYNHIEYSLTTQDAIDEVYKRMKLQINFEEIFDPVEEVTNDGTQ